LNKRVVLAGLLAPAVFLCALASARAGETTIGVTLDATIGTHSENPYSSQRLPLVPAPIFTIEHTQGRFSLFLEGLPPIGPVGFSNQGPGRSVATKLSMFDGSFRYVLPGGRVWAGVGETVLDQVTYYHRSETFVNTPYTDTLTQDQADASRVVGARFEGGINPWNRGGMRLDLSVAVSPRMHGRVTSTLADVFTTTDPSVTPDSHTSSYGFFETAALVDGQARFSMTRGRSTWSAGVRYVNYNAIYQYGYETDRNRLLMPFVGWATRI